MWSSSNTAVATINGTGNATAVSAGTTNIQATYQGLSGTSAFTVSAAVVTSISVTPIAPTMAAGTVQQFQAVAIFSDNTSQNVTGQATWASTNPAVAGVATNGFMRGRVTALTAGTTDIQATYQGFTGSTTVTVTAATLVSISVAPASITVVVGTTRQFTAAAIYSDGSSRDVTGMATWQSDKPAVASISTNGVTRGQAKALSAGTATIQASYGGLFRHRDHDGHIGQGGLHPAEPLHADGSQGRARAVHRHRALRRQHFTRRHRRIDLGVFGTRDRTSERRRRLEGPHLPPFPAAARPSPPTGWAPADRP